ncbi:TPA: PD-(D/E)XK nuclease-like domain-containing protein [Pasteurella multocida]|uniref:PD-(D/E)XK nuclease-like domain-containing protein n=1 Tax=Pasteurella multocida TaxID=747 RepID=UPI002B46094D|nr:PD-(D/E)XK nuclease-like domain-containing protein [Pasteurella multocida]WRK07323.1 PD-(D/E)XK nuclease-like domain-containing protein [Pasteurella multocida]
MAHVIENMTNADYHAHSAISKSGLDLIEKSPAHFFYAEREKTKAMIIGSAFHDLVLLPDVFNQSYIIKPDKLNLATKEGKEWKAQAEDKEILTQDEFEQINAMRESVLAHYSASKLLSQGKPETSIFWKDEIGVECRCRPDFIHSTGVIVDLKTTNDASPKGFAKSVAEYRYHVQDAYYSNGYKHAFGELPRGFVFIAVEKKPPYAVGVYTLDDMAKLEGEMRFKENLETYKQALEQGVWNAFSKNIETLSLPNWAFK